MASQSVEFYKVQINNKVNSYHNSDASCNSTGREVTDHDHHSLGETGELI